MRDFKQGGGRRFGGGRGGGFGRRDRGPAAMHQAICAQCGKSCEVPFRPTDGKPVYCNVCFGGRRETGNDRGGGRFPQKNFNGRITPAGNEKVERQLEILNVKMDQLIKAVKTIASPSPLAAEEKKTKKAAKKVSQKQKTNNR